MDGQDNDTNKNTQSGSTGAQGIFSTPELTVNAENITQQNNANTKSRVASIFANTDAGKQAQQLNNAMDAQTVPATEDIVIPSGAKKKSKLPVILLILVLVVAVIGGLVWFLVSNIKTEPEMTARQAFEGYYTYLVDGPDQQQSDNEDNVDDSTWFLLELQDSGLSVEEQESYISELKKRYEVFAGLADEKNKSVVDRYSDLFALSLVRPSLEIYTTQLMNIFKQSGAERAYDYIQSVAKLDSQYSVAASLSSALSQYLEAGLNVLTIYQKDGCLSESEDVVAACMDVQNTNQAYISAAQQQDQSYSLLVRYSSTIYVSFQRDTEAMLKILEEHE